MPLASPSPGPDESVEPRFPRVLSSDAAVALDMANQFQRFARAERERQTRTLDGQIAQLLEHARRHSPFWAARIPAGTVGLAALRDMQPLTRTELQTQAASIAADYPGKTGENLQIARTSGSTGIPVEVQKLQRLYMLVYSAVTLMDASWHRFDARKPLGYINGKAQNRESTAPYPPFCWYGPVASGFELCSDGLDMEQIYDYCVGKAPGYLRTGPHVLDRLAIYALNSGRTELRVDTCMTVGWEVSSELRDIVRRGLGAAINDRYSCEETGWVALQCPKHPHQHAISPMTYVEIVDEKGEACPPGVPGRVLLTSLHSFAMPIIRYEVGDVAEWGPQCDCGITLPVIARLWGRTRNVITTPAGQRWIPKFYFENFTDVPGLREFRFVLHQNAEVDAQVKLDVRSADADATIVQRIQAALHYPYPVRLRHVERVDWGKSWKQEYFAVSDEPLPG